MSTSITAKQVKELREQTGAGMMECKKALIEAQGDFEQAAKLIREWSDGVLRKKAHRVTNEGVISVATSEMRNKAALARLRCETDFASATDVFKQCSQDCADYICKHDIVSPEDALNADDYVIHSLIQECAHTIGENVQLDGIANVAGDIVVSYSHAGGRIVSAVGFCVSDQSRLDDIDANTLLALKDIAMQVAATSPLSITRDRMDTETLEEKKRIATLVAAKTEKSADIQERIVEGKMNAFFKENCLVEQVFVKDSKKTVQDVISDISTAIETEMHICDMARLEI